MTAEFNHLPYRRGVGIVLLNPDNRVFVGERIDSPGAWQMPQGGVDDGEDIETAFFREMKEEVGTDKAAIVKIMDRPLRYDLPPHMVRKLWGGAYRGQEQIWIAARFTGTDADISIESHTPPEFKAWQWASFDMLLGLIVPFKRETYRAVIEEFSHLAG